MVVKLYSLTKKFKNLLIVNVLTWEHSGKERARPLPPQPFLISLSLPM